MIIIVIGGTGTLGKAVVGELAKRHTIIVAGHQSGDVRVDITDFASVNQLYQSVGRFDAVVTTVGKVYFGDLTAMTPAQYQIGIHDKLMGQVNVVLAGLPHISDQGSFTLTSGILSIDPIRQGSSGTMVNAAIDGFVRGACIEMPRGIRINAVSPTLITESVADYGDYFHGFLPVSAARAALAYSKSVEGAQTGQIYSVGY